MGLIHLYFYRYDDWCTSNIEPCRSTWTRLEGTKVSVGIAEQGDDSLIGEYIFRLKNCDRKTV